jgi:hypothetical protein
MPPKPTNDLYLSAGREDLGHMPGHLAVTTVVYTGFAYLALTYAPDAGASKYLLYGLVMLPLAAPAAAMALQYAAVIGRRFAARLLVRRARRTFRSVLRAARVHPELADLDKLRAAAAALAQVAPGDALRASTEIALAAEHPYAPIRNAARSVIEATRERKREARSGPSGI